MKGATDGGVSFKLNAVGIQKVSYIIEALLLPHLSLVAKTVCNLYTVPHTHTQTNLLLIHQWLLTFSPVILLL